MTPKGVQLIFKHTDQLFTLSHHQCESGPLLPQFSGDINWDGEDPNSLK